MNRWSATASDDSAGQSPAATVSGGSWGRAHSPAHGFAATIERPGTTPSPARPDPRRTFNLETAPGRIDLAIECLLVAMLAFMPLALGVIAPWSEMVVISAAAALAVCLAAKTVFHRNGDGRRVVWSWSYVPIVLFVLLAVVQLVPLPAAVVKAISPGTFETKARLLADVGGIGDRLTLSFYPYGAARDLRVVLVATVMFIAVVQTFQRTAQIKRFLAAVAAIGGVIGLIALLQDITGTEKIFWNITTFGAARSGPFVNHNHYGQFINLSLGAALGLLLVRLREELPRRLTPAQVLDRLQDPELRKSWWLVGVVVIAAATQLLALSRGGVVAMLVATVFTASMIAVRRGLGGTGWLLSLLGLFAFIAVLYGGFDAVADRLASLHKDRDPTSGRVQIYKDVAVSWRKFPVAGMGLGSWELTYPMFDRSKEPAVAEYADSDYAQAAHEIGAVGLAVVLLFAGIIWAAYARAVRADRVPLCDAAFGLGFGLIAVMVQSASDYGQHMPAIAGLTAVTCGLLICLARRARAAARAAQRVPHSAAASNAADSGEALDSAAGAGRRHRRGVIAFPAAVGRLALPTALLVGIAWALLSVNNLRVAEGSWSLAQRRAARLEADGWQGYNEDYASLLTDASQAAARQPTNVQYQYWLNAYRWRSISRMTDPETGELMITDRSLEAAKRIVQELHAARRLCPTYGPPISLAGQLELLVLDRPGEGSQHVKLGRELAPNDAAAAVAAALVDVTEKRWDESLAKFRHCLVLNPNVITDAVAAYVGAGRTDLALSVSSGNPFWLHRLMSALEADGGYPEALEKARDEYLAVMSSRDEQAKASGWLLSEAAKLYRDRGDVDGAVEYYRKAVSKGYDIVPWRFELAKALAVKGENKAAMREARLCLRLKPELLAAKKLIEELSLRPDKGLPATRAATTGPAGTQPAETQPAGTQLDSATQPSGESLGDPSEE